MPRDSATSRVPQKANNTTYSIEQIVDDVGDEDGVDNDRPTPKQLPDNTTEPDDFAPTGAEYVAMKLRVAGKGKRATTGSHYPDNES